MGDKNFKTVRDGDTVLAEDVNQFNDALCGDIVPRDNLGNPSAASGASLGTLNLPWANLRSRILNVGGIARSYEKLDDLSTLDGVQEFPLTHDPDSYKVVRAFIVTKGGAPLVLGSKTAYIGGSGAALMIEISLTADIKTLKVNNQGGNISIIAVREVDEIEICKVTKGAPGSRYVGNDHSDYSYGNGGVITVHDDFLPNVIFYEQGRTGYCNVQSASVTYSPEQGGGGYTWNWNGSATRGLLTWPCTRTGEFSGSSSNQSQITKLYWS